jgi:hypothetical protein
MGAAASSTVEVELSNSYEGRRGIAGPAASAEPAGVRSRDPMEWDL